MFEIVIHLTSWLGLITGLTVLIFGDWRKFTLKYFGVTLSTASVVYLLIIQYYYGFVFHCITTMDRPCDQIHMFLFMRNLAFVIFHITSGRDTIRFKRCDRRFCLTKPQPNRRRV